MRYSRCFELVSFNVIIQWNTNPIYALAICSNLVTYSDYIDKMYPIILSDKYFRRNLSLVCQRVVCNSWQFDTAWELYRYPGTGEYDKFFGEGVYQCAGCGTPLYRSTTKFNSGCGWPAFYEGLPGAINRNVASILLFFISPFFFSR